MTDVIDPALPTPSVTTFARALVVGLRDAGRMPPRTSDPEVRAGLDRVRAHFAAMLSEASPGTSDRHFLHVARAAFRPGPTGTYPGLLALLDGAARTDVPDVASRVASARGHARTAMRVFLTPPLAVTAAHGGNAGAPDVELPADVLPVTSSQAPTVSGPSPGPGTPPHVAEGTGLLATVLRAAGLVPPRSDPPPEDGGRPPA